MQGGNVNPPSFNQPPSVQVPALEVIPTSDAEMMVRLRC